MYSCPFNLCRHVEVARRPNKHAFFCLTSTMDSQPTHESSSSANCAPQRTLPQVSFYSVEYPGYVAASSVPLAIRNIGGQTKVDHAFKRTTQKSDALLELSLRPDNPFSHPIPGDVIGANNLLLKVVKRKKKRSSLAQSEDTELRGEYTAEVAGIISKTARFRSESSAYICVFAVLISVIRYGGFSISTWPTGPRFKTANSYGKHGW